MEKRILSILVDNTSGVLSRVAGLFSRRGYNIESLTVGVTADPRYSRMTVVSLGDQNVLEQIKNQLNKLEDVRDIKELHPDRSVYRELMMIKVRAGSNDRHLKYFPCNHCGCGKRFPDCYADRRPVKTGCAH